MSTLEERFFSVPLRVESNGVLMPSSTYPSIVRINLRGEGNTIHPIVEDDIDAFIDIDKFDVPGAHTLPVQWRKKSTALGAEPLQITVEPAEITLVLDYRIHKIVPLVPKFQGQVDSGYAMTSYTVNPSQVIIDGPMELVWHTLQVSTEPVDLDGARDDFTMTVDVLSPDPLLTVRGTRKAEFHGIINHIVLVRNVSNIPITITNLMKGLTGDLEIRTAAVHLEGEDQNELNRFVPENDFLFIDCSKITSPGTYTLKVQSGTAENLRLRVEPNEVNVRIGSAAGGGKQ